MVLRIELVDEVDKFNELVFTYINGDKLEVVVEIENKTSIYDYFVNTSKFTDLYNKYLNEQYSYGDVEYADEIKRQLNIKNVLSNFEYVSFDNLNEESKKYYDENPVLYSMKALVTTGIYDRDLSNEIKEFYNKNEIYINSYGNKQIIPINIYDFITLYLDHIINLVNRFEFSPLEKLMFVYDIVRDREYIKSSDSYDKSPSRDLSRVLFEEEIVCEGFINIYNVLMQKLGLSIHNFILINKKDCHRQHVRSIAHVKDDKYFINGVYFIDPTHDCKRNNTNDYLNSYRYFCRTKEHIDELDKGKYYDDIPLLGEMDVELDFELIERKKLMMFVDNDVRKAVNFISNLVNKKNLINTWNMSQDKYEVVDEVYELRELLDKPINPLVLSQVLKRVKDVQHSIDPEKYSNDLNVINSIAINSTAFSDNEKELLDAIFNKVKNPQRKKLKK